MNGGVFDNMAPTAKRSFIITIVLFAIAVVIYLFCLQPCESELERTKRSLSELQDKQARMNADLRNAGTVKKDLEELNAALKLYQDAMLVPLLESYAMRAKTLLDPLILGAGLQDVQYNNDTFRALPLPNPMPRQLHTRAAIKVTANGSYQQAISFLLRLEKEFPLVSLRQLGIVSQSSPEHQALTFVLEWPAKGGLTRK
jgi:Tfp pilus assembly protein PilO